MAWESFSQSQCKDTKFFLLLQEPDIEQIAYLAVYLIFHS